MTSSHTPRLPIQAPEGIKSPVATATIADTDLQGLQTINGYQLNVNDRVLVMNQVEPAQNGIYSAQQGRWVRTQDWKVGFQIANGVLVLDINTGVLWRASFAGVLKIDVTPVTFTAVVSNADNSLRSQLADVDSTVLVAGSPAKDFKTVEPLRAAPLGSYSKILKGLTGKTDGQAFFQKINSTRFEAYIPFYQSGRFLAYRFDKDESVFSPSPDDSAQSYSRPWLQTNVGDFLVEEKELFTGTDATTSSPPVDSGLGLYVDGVGEFFEWSGIGASRLSIIYREASNAGIMRVTINGNTDLINLADPEIDMYSASTTGVITVELADNLPDVPLTVRFEVIGKNASSTGERIYVLKGDESPNASAIDAFRTFSGVGTPISSLVENLKIGTSAVERTVSFRPDELPTAVTPFIASVHGWENVTSETIRIDNKVLDFASLTDGAIIPFEKDVSILLNTDIFHPEKTTPKSASTVLKMSISKENGYTCGHEWTWDADVFITNGYSAMFTAWGGSSGGAGGALVGWANRALFKGYGVFPLENGDSQPVGNVPVDEVVVYGTEYDAGSEPGRNLESGLTCCVFELADLNRSMDNFDSTVAYEDSVWVNDRATFKKIYVQPFRAKGTVLSGNSFSSLFSANFLKMPDCSFYLNNF